MNKQKSTNIFIDYKYYSFYKAVEHLEYFFAKKSLGETLDPDEENIRFAVRPDLGFPATDIVDLKSSNDNQVSMEISFLGLVGPSGVLPSWYNELAIELDKKIKQTFNEFKKSPPDETQRRKYKIFERLLKLKKIENWQTNQADDFDQGINLHSSLSDFFNIFHHRLITFYYLAWRKTKLPGFNQQIDTQLLSFAGLNSSRMIKKLNMPSDIIKWRCGLFSRNNPSAKSVEIILQGITKTNVSIKPFIERQIIIPKDELTVVGCSKFKLGKNTICGKRYWDCQSLFQVIIGPMNYKQFEYYIPNGNMHLNLFKMIQTITGPEYEFEIVLLLKNEEVPDLKTGAMNLRLGYNTWLKKESKKLDNHPKLFFSADYIQRMLRRA